MGDPGLPTSGHRGLSDPQLTLRRASCGRLGVPARPSIPLGDSGGPLVCEDGIWTPVVVSWAHHPGPSFRRLTQSQWLEWIFRPGVKFEAQMGARETGRFEAMGGKGRQGFKPRA